MPVYIYVNITDSREKKDQDGKIIGRQFLVLRKDYGEKGTWQPFEKLLYAKKALKSYYNKHPQLPYPNCLAEDQDEEFNPVDTKKNTNKGYKSSQENYKEPTGNSTMCKQSTENSYKLSTVTPTIKNAKGIPDVGYQSPRMPSQPKNSGMHIQGLFVDAKTDQIIYRIITKGKQSYQNRKWVVTNCKLELIEFYERCMKFRDK